MTAVSSAIRAQRACESPADRVRVMKFITNFYIGGTERQFMVLSRGLDRTRFDVRTACLRREGPFLAAMEEEGIPVSEHRIGRLYHPGTLVRQWRFGAMLRAERIQIVHTYGFYPNTFAIAPARAARVPVIIASIRDIGDIWTLAQRRLQKTLCRLAHAVAVNAEAVRRRLIDEGYDPRKLHVIENGIDVSRFRGGPPTGWLHRELGLPPATPLIGVVSRLNRDKGISHLLRAAAALRARHPGARFLLMGDGPARSVLQQEARELGIEEQVLFLGFRTDVTEILPELTLSVLPSLSEAMSNVVLESMAAERPVVVTRVGGLPEVVHDGVHGFLVAPGDPDSLARATEMLLDNRVRAEAMGRAGRRRIVRDFSRERMIERTQRLYESLLEERARRRP